MLRFLMILKIKLQPNKILEKRFHILPVDNIVSGYVTITDAIKTNSAASH